MNASPFPMNTTTMSNIKTELDILEKILFTTGLTILSILSLFGNTLVVISFSTYRPLRSLTNYFIVSLAMSDVAVAIINMPVWIAFVMMDMDFSVYGGKLLKAWTCFDIMFGVASIMNLVAVSVDRYIHITKPMTHQKLITKPRVLVAIVFIWVFACGLSLIKGLNWKWQRPNYEMLVFVVGFLLPVSVIILCYIKMYRVVKQQLKKFKLNAVNKHDMKAIRTIAIVIFAFIICWTPFFILNVIHGWCRCPINQHVITFAKLLHYCNSALNPIIYACFNKDYRTGFRNALFKYVNSKKDNGAFSSIVRRTPSFINTFRSVKDQSFDTPTAEKKTMQHSIERHCEPTKL